MKTKSNPNIPTNIYMEEHFNALMHYLSFGVSFPQEMKSHKIMNGKLPFVKKTLEYSAKHPELIPGYESLPIFQKDKQMERDLKMFASDATETLDKISENKGAVGYIAYAYAVAFLENAKHASEKKINAGTRVYNELKKEFQTHLKKAA